jgi:hypothetical protein
MEAENDVLETSRNIRGRHNGKKQWKDTEW